MDALDRRFVVALATLGLLISVARLRPIVGRPSDAPPPAPTERLARDMEVYELAIEQGSEESLFALRSVKRECAAATEALAHDACSRFLAAVRHDSDAEAIKQAVQTLRSAAQDDSGE